MGKHLKLPARPARARRTTATADEEDPLDRIERVLTRALDGLEAALDRGDATPALVRESAAVARALLQAQASRDARTSEITLARVLQWARSKLNPTERRDLAKALAALDTRGSILS